MPDPDFYLSRSAYGESELNGSYSLTCPRCNHSGVHQREHYQHHEEERPEILIEILRFFTLPLSRYRPVIGMYLASSFPILLVSFLRR